MDTYPRTPSELVEMRRRWVEWAKTPFGQQWLEDLPFIDDALRDVIGRIGKNTFKEMLIESVSRASLYLVTPEMQQLIDMASEDVPPVKDLTPDDLPDTCGLLAWGGGPHENSNVVADLWFPFMGGEENGKWYYIILNGMFSDLSINSKGDFQSKFPRVTCVAFDPMPLGNLGDEVVAQFYKDPGRRRLLAVLLLMQQKVGHIEKEHVSRPLQRASARAKIPNTSVSVIYLPKIEYEQSESQSTDRSYSHRFLVRGFWRNQWYPSRQVNRPKYIAPFIKGPNDKPIVLKERVHVVKPPPTD